MFSQMKEFKSHGEVQPTLMSAVHKIVVGDKLLDAGISLRTSFHAEHHEGWTN
jgi:hypothetical protein